MTFTANQELTTSITNLINSIITFFLLMNVLHLKKEKEGKLLWIITFGLFLISSFAGAAVHGIVLNSEVKRTFWIFLNFILCFTLGAYSLCIFYEVYGYKFTRKLIPVYCAICLLVSLYNNFIATGYTRFVVFCIADLLLLMIVLLLNIRKKPYFIIFILSIIIFIIGSYLQTVKSLNYDFIVSINHDGIYHLFVLVFVLLNYFVLLKTDR